MTYKIDIKRGLKRTRQAYNDQALAAQNGAPCRYSGDKGPCAVGVMLPKKVLSRIRGMGANSTDFLTLSGNLALVQTATNTQRLDLQTLQNTHDRWAQNPTLEREAAFETQLTLLEQKYGVVA